MSTDIFPKPMLGRDLHLRRSTPTLNLFSSSASKNTNIPSEQNIRTQAQINAPSGGGFLSQLLSVGKDILLASPFSFKVGKYRIRKAEPWQQQDKYIYIPYKLESPIEEYMPYILIGGGILTIILITRR